MGNQMAKIVPLPFGPIRALRGYTSICVTCLGRGNVRTLRWHQVAQTISLPLSLSFPDNFHENQRNSAFGRPVWRNHLLILLVDNYFVYSWCNTCNYHMHLLECTNLGRPINFSSIFDGTLFLTRRGTRPRLCFSIRFLSTFPCLSSLESTKIGFLG